MDFEFDLEKSTINKAKHGIDFIEAQELWKDPSGLSDYFTKKSVIGSTRNRLRE